MIPEFLDFLFGEASVSQIIMNAILSLAGVAVIISMWKLHRANSRYENFNVVSLLVNNEGYLDGAKCMEMGAFLLMSWGFVALLVSGRLTDTYTSVYVATFALRGAFGAMLRSKKAETPPEEGITKVTKVDVKTVEVSKEPKT